MKVPDYVLGRFTKEEQEQMLEVIQRCTAACEEWISKPFLQIMNEFNQ
jgi:PTH1 family peptidyl-tRNA hydrolase